MNNKEYISFENVLVDFENICVKCKRADICNTVFDKMNSVVSDDKKVFDEIVDILNKGNVTDLDKLLSRTFSLPLGLHFALLNILDKMRLRCQQFSVKEYIKSDGKYDFAVSIWDKWRSGQCGPVEFYSQINSNVASGKLGNKSASDLTHLMLKTGGYNANDVDKVVATGNGQLVEIQECELHQVSQIFCDSTDAYLTSTEHHSATIHTFSGQSIRLSGCKTKTSCGFAGTPCVSSDSFLWKSVGGDTPKLLIRTINSEPSVLTRQVLLIGDYISVPHGVVEVGEVLSVDTLQQSTEDVADTFQHIVVLVEGRILNGTDKCMIDRGNDHSGQCEGLCYEEGISELGGRDDVSHSSDGSDSGADHHAIPLSVLHKRYFCLFAVVYRDEVTVQHALAIHDEICPDQIPTRVLYAAQHIAIISGSNGLLGSACLMSTEAKEIMTFKDEVASYTDLEKDSDHKSPVSDCRDKEALFGCQTLCFHNFTNDNPENTHSTNEGHGSVSHSGASTIVATSYSRAGRLLASGDNMGTICVWRVETLRGRGRLVAAPFSLGQLYGKGKICGLQMSPSGHHIAMSLWDRLLLLSVQQSCGDILQPPRPSTAASTVALTHSLIVRCCLDSLDGSPAKYAVQFTCDDCRYLRVWRASRNIVAESNNAEQTRGIVLTSWFHPNIDVFDQRFVPSGAEVKASMAVSACSMKRLSKKGFKRDISVQSSDHSQKDFLETFCINDDSDQSTTMVCNPILCAVTRDTSTRTSFDGDSSEDEEDECDASEMSFGEISGEYVPIYKTTFVNLSASDDLLVECGVAVNSDGLKCGSDFCSYEVSSSRLTGVPGKLSGNDLSSTLRPFRDVQVHETSFKFTSLLVETFQHDHSDQYLRVKSFLAVYCACLQPPSVGLLAAVMEQTVEDVEALITSELGAVLTISTVGDNSVVNLTKPFSGINKWLCSNDNHRVGRDFWIDMAYGHNRLCALYLRHCGNKSVAVEHPWQDYLRTYGPSHLRRSSRGLRQLTTHIRKIDETANIKYNLPHQVGYITGLQEIYARRVGLGGRIPKELGQLSQLRVLSMGNNRLYGELPSSLGDLKNLQRIVLHQNNLQGAVPSSLGLLGCIVNLAGNPRLHHGEDVPLYEKEALIDLFAVTKGIRWSTKTNWCSSQHVAKWYKVGVLTSHVHSIVMSSNGMEGRLPVSISRLTHLRMIELATMPGLTGPLPRELCELTTLRRLCICRCGLSGKIPSEIGNLLALEELQLFGNQLNGAIPSSISLLTNLKLLSFGEYTGGNSFASAPLPSCLSSLVNLEALFMANCNLRGSLPDWIGNLKELRQLDLQRNTLSGPLPGSIGLLENLLYLNIKDNEGLCGRLPLPQLMTLTKLNRLSLVHCGFQEAESDVEVLRVHLPRCKIWI